ncbi:IS66 family transposase [Vagococcus silagei]|uniref:Transposase n=1 Tax=Vagococcus silagei TaxID=2508885 RepID=A0A4S3B521_9ENTE|nr:transposase [Vagococcus silagei]
MRVLEDGSLELSNNRSERQIKEIVMGRKNWLFSQSTEGATASGVILSIMKTAEANGLDVRKYLIYLFDETPNLDVLSDEVLSEYLPWSNTVQSHCSK